MSQFQQDSITALVNSYGLSFEGMEADTIVATWIRDYESDWIVKAIVEAVFRGRYKVRSVDDILKQWQRLGKPLYHFKPDFERERLEKFSIMPLLLEISISSLPNDSTEGFNKECSHNGSFVTINNEPLNPEELAPFHHSRAAILLNNSVEIDSSFEIEDMTDIESSTVGVALEIEPGTVDESICKPELPKRMRLLYQLKTAIGEESVSEEQS